MHLSFTTALTEVEIQARAILIEPWPAIVFHFESKNKNSRPSFQSSNKFFDFYIPKKFGKKVDFRFTFDSPTKNFGPKEFWSISRLENLFEPVMIKSHFSRKKSLWTELEKAQLERKSRKSKRSLEVESRRSGEKRKRQKQLWKQNVESQQGLTDWFWQKMPSWSFLTGRHGRDVALSVFSLVAVNPKGLRAQSLVADFAH